MYTIAETFVGAGGAHIGFLRNGFRSVYVNELNEDCLRTLIYNNQKSLENTYIDNRSILDVKGEEVLRHSGLKEGELDVLFGGLVCKGFSLAGERSPNDERNYFYHKQLEIVDSLRPKLSIIENVPGITNAKVLSHKTPLEIKNKVDRVWQNIENYKGKKASLSKENKVSKEVEKEGESLRGARTKLYKELSDQGYLVPVLEDIKSLYNELGYDVKIKRLNTAWYGGATSRVRVIIVAIRKDININFEYPTPTHYSDDLSLGFDWKIDKKLLKSPKTVKDALKCIDYEIDDKDNEPMNHKKKTIKRFTYIPEGKNIVDVMELVPKDLRISSFYSRGSTMRLDRNKPSPTLVPGHSNFPVHPSEHRSITVREAASISGFPNDYKFFGTHSKRCEHVGNAVPVELAEAIARACRKFLDQYYDNIS